MINPQTDALIIVDAQFDFLPGGALGVKDGDKIIAPILDMIHKFSTVVATQDWHPTHHISFASSLKDATTGEPAKPFTTVQIPMSADGGMTLGGSREQALWPDHCVAGSMGAALVNSIANNPFVSLVLRKGTNVDTDSYSAFRENVNPIGKRPPTGLADYLRAREITRVFVVGLAFDFCVAWTAKDAVAEGFRAVVLKSGTRAVFPENDAATAHDLSSAGVSVWP